MVRSLYGCSTVTVLSRYAPGSLAVWYAQGSFVPGILALRISSLETLHSSLLSGGSRSLLSHNKLTNTDDAGSHPFFGKFFNRTGEHLFILKQHSLRCVLRKKSWLVQHIPHWDIQRAVKDLNCKANNLLCTFYFLDLLI